jgi:anti-sigma regulatory factor (Ser/Thr protein kinase)
MWSVSPPGLELRLPNEPFSAGKARRFVRNVLLEWDIPHIIDDAELATSELVANVVRHAGTELMLRVEVADVVKISVRDWHPELGPVRPRESFDLAEHGRGLRIVAALAMDCGVDVSADSKTVWLTLPIRSPISL